MIEKVSSSDGMRVVCASCSVKSNLLYGGRKISPSSGIIDGLVFSDLILSERCYLELSSGFGFEWNEIEMETGIYSVSQMKNSMVYLV